jgi:pyridoxamine 5'-phosphate oxidase
MPAISRLTQTLRTVTVIHRMSLHSAAPPTSSASTSAAAANGSQSSEQLTSRTTPGQAAQFLLHERQGGLVRSSLNLKDPIAQFRAWYDAASKPEAGIAHPETCTLATAELPSGRVSARMVYLKEIEGFGDRGVEGGGFVVYSNFGTSRKGADLFGDQNSSSGGGSGNPNAALVFWWEPLERQVRVEGRAERVTEEQSQAYYDTRVRGSRIGAWASQQSSVLSTASSTEGEDDGRAKLDGWVAETEKRLEGQEHIPVPPFWGGLRIIPSKIEFWQGRENRLHDRFVYEKQDEQGAEGETKWRIARLSP